MSRKGPIGQWENPWEKSNVSTAWAPVWKGACRCAFTPPDPTHVACVWKPFILRNTACGLERWRSSPEHLLFLRTQDPHGASQAFVIPVSRGPMPLLWPVQVPGTHTQHTYLQAGKALTHIEINRASWKSNAVCQHLCIVLCTDSRDPADYQGTKA